MCAAPLRRTVSESHRNIAAPYQNPKTPDATGFIKRASSEPTASTVEALAMETTDVDYQNFTFQPLELDDQITFEKYCGPTPESNWVIPGVLLVGAYPASQDDYETYDLITSILKLGITKFVCLQQEYRAGVTAEMWRRGDALRPYFDDVQNIVKNKENFENYIQGCHVVAPENLKFTHFPIRDCSVTDDDRVLDLAKDLVRDISEGEVLYLHCWGGHGRTGTLVCIMLYLMYGLGAPESMRRCQKVHDLRHCPVEVGSPQTQSQRDQVTRVIKRLQAAARMSSSSSSSSSPHSGTSSPKPLRKAHTVDGTQQSSSIRVEDQQSPRYKPQSITSASNASSNATSPASTPHSISSNDYPPSSPYIAQNQPELTLDQNAPPVPSSPAAQSNLVSQTPDYTVLSIGTPTTTCASLSDSAQYSSDSVPTLSNLDMIATPDVDSTVGLEMDLTVSAVDNIASSGEIDSTDMDCDSGEEIRDATLVPAAPANVPPPSKKNFRY